MFSLTIILGLSALALIFLGIVGMLLWRNRTIRIVYYRWKYKENFLRIVLLCANNRAIEHFGFIRENLTIDYMKDETYVVNPVDVIYMNGIPTLFYIRGNPNPLDFYNAKNSQILVDATNLNKVMNQKIIKDLLTENNLLYWILLAVIVVGALHIVTLLKLFGAFK